MNFTGKNLELVRAALDLALMEIHNQIATCPDVHTYAEDIEQLEKEREAIKKMINRIDGVNL